MKVKDLDILRPESVFIKIGGKEIDVSFIPCAITFDIDTVMQELSNYTEKEIKTNPQKAKEAFDLSIKLCAIFCEHKYPELDEVWFQNNTDAFQIKYFTECIRTALMKAYAGIDTYSKNPKAAKGKKAI